MCHFNSSRYDRTEDLSFNFIFVRLIFCKKLVLLQIFPQMHLLFLQIVALRGKTKPVLVYTSAVQVLVMYFIHVPAKE